MAYQPFANRFGFLLTPQPSLEIPSLANATLNAAGESLGMIGHMLLSSGPGTSKTISGAGGGSIAVLVGSAVTFADAGTTIRIGIQDVDGATGLEDGTHDVYAELVGGTDTITATTVRNTVMETNTKTITHGDQVAVVIEMTARGGTDSVIFNLGGTAVAMMPYTTADTGSGPVLTSRRPYVTVVFDDGTIGWFSSDSWVGVFENATAFSNASTPDEYALVFQVPVPMVASGLFGMLASVAAADDFEMILYSDPLGTPVAERTIVQDMTLAPASAGTAFIWERPFTSTYTLNANTNYAVALRPTTANTINFLRTNFNASNGALRGATILGTNWSQYTRTDQTGAFGSQNLTVLPHFGVRIAQLDDAVSAGGGGPLIGGRLVR